MIQNGYRFFRAPGGPLQILKIVDGRVVAELEPNATLESMKLGLYDLDENYLGPENEDG